MSVEKSEDRQVGVLRQAYRTVSPAYRAHEDAEMDSIGWAIFLVMLALLLPLLPFVLIIWLVSKGIEVLAGRE